MANRISGSTVAVILFSAGVGAGAERAARVDHDGNGSRRRSLPGRADPQLPDPHRPVEVAPAVLPARLHILPLGSAEGPTHAHLAVGVGVRRQLDPAPGLALLEALREELEQLRPRLLGALRRDGDADPAQGAQLNALRSRSKKPSSGR